MACLGTVVDCWHTCLAQRARCIDHLRTTQHSLRPQRLPGGPCVRRDQPFFTFLLHPVQEAPRLAPKCTKSLDGLG
jgi:hypothetical protein